MQVKYLQPGYMLNSEFPGQTTKQIKQDIETKLHYRNCNVTRLDYFGAGNPINNHVCVENSQVLDEGISNDGIGNNILCKFFKSNVLLQVPFS